MKILKFSLNQLQANCYFLIEGDDCLIIDPADDASFILEEIQRRKLKLKVMLATHGHFDHIMAAGEMQLSLNVPLYINEKDLFLVDRLKDTVKHFLGLKTIVLPIKQIINSLKIKNYKLKIFNTPGHTPGGVCYYFPKEKIIFTGDTLFKGAVGRYDFSYANKKDLNKSLLNLFKLPPETVVYPGHGEMTTIGEESAGHL